ncbi:MAG: hypothetical protein HC843_06045 [Sphingomonadales bacterium]|nr:hypothetical protein [Sphingomonadales bacterium]
MNQYSIVKTPWHLWAIGVVTLLWNGIGILSYMMTRLGKLESLGMTAEHIAYFDSFPVWANSAWALGVWGAFFGSLLLLLRSRWAVISIVLSVIGMIGTTIFERFYSDIPPEMNNIGLSAAIWIITLMMLFYVVKMRSVGVLR